MTKLSSKADAIIKAYYNVDTTEEDGIIALLCALADEVVPHEEEAPKAVFDCEPRQSFNFKTGIRLQLAQEELNVRWEQRQQTRAAILAIVTELENV